MADNSVSLTGSIVERQALRYTPARIPVMTFRIAHQSRQMEAEVEREVSCEMEACVIGSLAHQISALPVGTTLRMEGFLAARSARSRNPVLHVRTFELLEGNQNGL